MNPNLKEFLRRSEVLQVGGSKFVIKGLPTAADLHALQSDPDYGLKVLVLCTYMEDGVTSAFTMEDLPDLKNETSIQRMIPLFEACNRVNGLDREAEVKNSDAVPSGG